MNSSRWFAASLSLVVVAACGSGPSSAQSDPAEASPLSLPASGCLVKHLEAAQALNRVREPLYAAQTWGLSVVVSSALVASEGAMQVPGYLLDVQATALDDAGVPVLCEDLVPMSGAAAFQASTPPEGTFDPSIATSGVAEVEAAIATGSFDTLAATADSVIGTFSVAPTFHCMTRHLLESIRRAATLAPGQVARAKSANLDSTASSLSWSFINLQASGLGAAKALDIVAAPLQAAGADIICRDVPPIPAH